VPESWASNHIVFRIPINITNCVHELAFIIFRVKFTCENIPDKGRSCLRSTCYISCIWRDAWSDIDWFILCSKESKSDSGFFSSFHFIFNDPNTVVFRVNNKFILLLRIDHNSSDRVIFKLFMLYYKFICCMNFSLKYWDIPTSNEPNWISNEHSTCIIKSNTVGMNVIS